MVHIKKLNEMAVNAQRSVSYGELAELENMFNDQVEKRHIVFSDTEESTEALFDFIQQYIEGNDNPQVNVGYRESRRANAHGRALNEMAGNAQRSVSYGELAELENMFNDQIKRKHIVFSDPEESSQALFDFIQQYIEGNDNPQVSVM